MFDLVIKGGEVIDSSQNIHKKMDVGITEGDITFLGENILCIHRKGWQSALRSEALFYQLLLQFLLFLENLFIDKEK